MDKYQEITNQIIESLEAGTTPWVKPWASSGAPYNVSTGNAYQGINHILLSMSPYKSSGWMTFNQARDCGGSVRRGEKSSAQVVFFKPLTIKDKATDEEKQIPLLKTSAVFNIEQIEGLPEKYLPKVLGAGQSFEDNTRAAALMSQAKVVHGGSQACFIPSRDEIHLPNKTEFKSAADYHATALHELTHWTGHKPRLDRTFGARFGDNAYAFEELVAELGAAFLCSDCGIDGKLQHETYIASWVKVLKDDKRAIFTASSAARKAADFAKKVLEVQLAA
jgi:antirestriction protein ArdC